MRKQRRTSDGNWAKQRNDHEQVAPLAAMRRLPALAAVLPLWAALGLPGVRPEAGDMTLSGGNDYTQRHVPSTTTTRRYGTEHGLPWAPTATPSSFPNLELRRPVNPQPFFIKPAARRERG